MKQPVAQISSQGARMSRLVYGAWRLCDDPEGLQPGRVREKIDVCLELGITTFDHADLYGGYLCEEAFGQALAGESSLREQMQLVSKCGIKLVHPRRPAHTIKHYDTSATHIVASAEASLKALRTEWLDILLLHRPDPLMDADEVCEAFVALQAAGKVRHFGVSNFTPAQIGYLQSRLPFPLVTNQIELSVLHLDPLHDSTLDACAERKIAPMAWSPFGGGRLFKDESERPRRVRAALRAVGEQLQHPHIDAIALAWLLKHPAGIVPILGTNAMSRVRQAATACALTLSREMWFSIWCASAGRDVP